MTHDPHSVYGDDPLFSDQISDPLAPDPSKIRDPEYFTKGWPP